MREYLKQETNFALTENGGAAYTTTGSDCLDLFSLIGAMRAQSDEQLCRMFDRAWAEDPDLAMKILFFARDIRGGLGERRIFRTILRDQAGKHADAVRKNVALIAEYGRFDDCLCLMGTPCERAAIDVFRAQLDADLAALKNGEPVSLLAKWLPSVNATNKETVKTAKDVAFFLGMRESEYRKTLTALRAQIRLIENDLRRRDYCFDYEKQPSRALFKYKKAFLRNDRDRYLDFLSRAERGEAKIHADNVAPYELAASFFDEYGSMRAMTPEQTRVINATWEQLPDFGGEENALAVIDTSGSMHWTGIKPMPAAAALSLGLYFAQHNRGRFANCFIEFSETPQLIELKGETFADRLRYAASFCQVANTNLAAVFDLVLSTARKHRLPQEELPAKLVIVSDMEFDACVDDASKTVFERARKRYAACGYRLPKVVFWNVAARHAHVPVTRNEQGAALVSGVTPRIFSMVAGNAASPYDLMLEILSGERYRKITA